jgi:hypothetical protein
MSPSLLSSSWIPSSAVHSQKVYFIWIATRESSFSYMQITLFRGLRKTRITEDYVIS